MYRYQIDDSANVITVEFHGDIVVEDYEGLINDLVADRKFKRSPKILIDQRDGHMSIPTDKVQSHPHFLQQMQDRLGLPTVAVVVGSDLDFGINRMFEVYSEGVTEFVGEVFRDIADARRWLGIAEEK